MKSMISLFIINILIILFFILSFWYKVFFIPVSILLILNIIAIEYCCNLHKEFNAR